MGSAKYTRPVSTKELLKHARSLQQKKFRDQHGQFLVQGAKVVRELLESDWQVDAVLSTEACGQRMALHRAIIVPAHELERVGTLETGNEVVAIARKPQEASPAAMGTDELVIGLDGINDPGNLGTVIRIADWFGVKRLWCAQGSVDAFNPKTVQAAMGALFRVSVTMVDLPVMIMGQRAAGVQVYLASMEGRSVFDVQLARPAVLVMGSESHGVSAAVREAGGEVIAIPGGYGSESLNVATATAALCMEFARQRVA